MFLAVLSFYVVPFFSSFVQSCVFLLFPLCSLLFQLGVRAFGGVFSLFAASPLRRWVFIEEVP